MLKILKRKKSMVIAEDTKTIRNYLPSQLAIEAAIEAAIAAADPERFRGPVSSARRFRKSCEEASFRFYSAAPWPDREKERETGERRKRVERKRGQKNGGGTNEGQRSTQLSGQEKRRSSGGGGGDHEPAG